MLGLARGCGGLLGFWLPVPEGPHRAPGGKLQGRTESQQSLVRQHTVQSVVRILVRIEFSLTSRQNSAFDIQSQTQAHEHDLFLLELVMKKYP